MTDKPRIGGFGYPRPGSPLAVYLDRINAMLEAGEIPCACPHDATELFLPEEILCCVPCSAPVRKAFDDQSHECALCPAPATGVLAWMAGNVNAGVHLCADCGELGGPPSLN